MQPFKPDWSRAETRAHQSGCQMNIKDIAEHFPLKMLNWRESYIISIALRFVFAVSNSYIHPDEHFQNFEVLASSILGYTTNLPWEFTSDAPARSLGPLYLAYAPILYLIKALDLQFTPLQIWYVVRLQFLLVSWICTDYCVYRMLPTRPERVKGVFFILTSYITMVYQSHCFSNSIETILVLFSVLYIEELRFYTNEKKKDLAAHYWKLGALLAVGFFNRITFVTFLVLPLVFVFNHLRHSNRKVVSLLFGVLGFAVPALLFVAVDSLNFNGTWDPLDFHTYLVTPWNNLVYNSDVSNLAKHGIHPLYTHVLVNLPQVLGPGLVLLFYKGNKYYKATPFLAMISGLLGLSLVPHQELRFLVPVVPLACCCFDIEKFLARTHKEETEEDKQTKEEEQKEKDKQKEEKESKTPWIVTITLIAWYAFNLLMSVLMGVFHQGGVLPALDHFHAQYFASTATEASGSAAIAQIWWRTYTPPTWILGNVETTSKTRLQVILSTSESPVALDAVLSVSESRKHLLIDAMGSDFPHIQEMAQQLRTAGFALVYLVTPVASYLTDVEHFNQYTPTWNYTYHLDLDHLDIHNLESFTPGIGIYSLI